MTCDDMMYLENLDEFVNDENKVVTYKWLSRTLGVHVNQAKQMLQTFVQQQRNEKNNDSLSVVYLLAGLQINDQKESCMKVQIAREESLDALKNTYKSVTSCHIYSVQKGQLKDSNALYSADYQLLKENILNSNKYSAIQYEAAKPRSAEDVSKLKHAGATQPPPEASVPVNKGMNGSAAKSKKAGGAIAGMFANQDKKKETDVKDKPTAETKSDKSEETVSSKPSQTAPQKQDKSSKAAGKKKGGQAGVMSFFAKQANKPPKEQPKLDDKPPVLSDDEEPMIEDPPSPKPSPKKEQEEKKEEVKPAAKKKETKESKTKKETKTTEKKKDTKAEEKGRGKGGKSTTKGRRKKTSEDDEDVEGVQQKKRRRIKAAQFDSSSEEEDAEMLAESPVAEPEPPSPVREASPEVETPKKDSQVEEASSASGSAKRRKRKRKLVSKTSINDEGFMVTEKVWESDSTDDEDPVPPSPKKTPVKDKGGKKTSPKKKSPLSKKDVKQTSLMSFFKKK